MMNWINNARGKKNDHFFYSPQKTGYRASYRYCEKKCEILWMIRKNLNYICD